MFRSKDSTVEIFLPSNSASFLTFNLLLFSRTLSYLDHVTPSEFELISLIAFYQSPITDH